MHVSQSATSGAGGGCGVQLEACIRSKLAGRRPLIFTGGCLHGHRSGTGKCQLSAAQELLGRGVVVFLDPREANRVGTYEFFFYGEKCLEPLARWPVGPHIRMERQPSVRGSAATFLFHTHGEPCCAISFDTEEEANAFERDFLVRQRLMTLALQVARHKGGIGHKSPIFGKVFWSLRSLLLPSALVVLVLVAACVVLRLMDDPQRPTADTLEAAVSDSWAAAQSAGRATMDAAGTFTAAACDVFTGASGVPTTALEQCASSQDEMELRRCLAGLVQQAKSDATA